MDFLIITGMSGGGKSRVSSILEDIGFYCVDNMPAVLIPRFAELTRATKGRYERVALVTDVRGGESFDVLFESLDRLSEAGCAYKIVFVEASEEVIIHRYKETRRSHPLASLGLGLAEAVRRERIMLEPLRNMAHYLINTTTYSIADLRAEILRLFSEDVKRTMPVKVCSFGYKHGLPADADLVFDVRFLPNPYYIDELRNLTGLDEEVRSFVFSYQQSIEFMELLQNLMTFLLPHFVNEGKTNLVIAIGCTGGQHRSVVVAEKLGEFIAQKGYPVSVTHLHKP
ncbi:MAG: RNase adapter RapZ [Oscillospiraceae bacterium]|jgi:UPF0042 nucleotide-binding protein